MSELNKKHLRCAIYTRKSSEEGLDQEHNSIDAQRDAGHAYIASQRAEGWTAVGADYDDPAYSGGNMERPALKRLMRANLTRATTEFLLKGIVFGEDGRALSPSQSTKKSGRRYRYYVHQREVKEFAGASGLPRIVAADLESAVLEQLRGLMRAPALLTDAIAQAKRCDATLDEAKVTVAMNRLDAIWAQMFPAEQTRMIKLMVEKVIISTKQLEVRLRANGMERLILEMRPDAAVAA